MDLTSSPERQIPTILPQEILYSQTTPTSPSASYQPKFVSSMSPMQNQFIAQYLLQVDKKLISLLLTTDLIVDYSHHYENWLASQRIHGISDDLQTKLDNELRMALFDDMIAVFFFSTEPRMKLSHRELIEIPGLGQPMAYDPASPDRPFLVSCTATYSMDLPFSVHRDLYVISMERKALQMLSERLLQITNNSVQLRRCHEADIDSYTVPPPSGIPSAIQELLAFPASSNLYLASRGACLTCTMEGGRPQFKDGTSNSSWASHLITELKGLGMFHYPFVSICSSFESQPVNIKN